MSIVPVPESIRSFRDALGLALELSDEFAFAHAAVVLSCERRCLDLGVFTAIDDNLPELLGWLSERFQRQPQAETVLLISVRSVDAWLVYERDLGNYRFARATITEFGGRLLDWIETDGELVRSYAHLANPNTEWSIEAEAEGALDANRW